MDRYGGSDADLDARIVKSQTAFKNLSKIWTSKKIAIKTKMKIFNSNVKTVLKTVTSKEELLRKAQKKDSGPNEKNASGDGSVIHLEETKC